MPPLADPRQRRGYTGMPPMHDEAPQYVLDALRLLHEKSLYKLYVETSRQTIEQGSKPHLPTAATTRSIYRVVVLERAPK